ncbi:MAG: hypothetical protein ACREP4_01050 [Stenotrophomonas sp.]|uniref:hypothetical protein n=1 Tax=Stenotrophomonas sp. TaxID=69392 RepID=UPI003D6CC97B
MSYESLRANFDNLAFEIVVEGFGLSPTERSSKMQELCLLAARVMLEVEGSEDEVKILCNLDGIMHRAHSLISALEQCEDLRAKSARNYLGSLHTASL